jgi:hypothetical protein
LQAPALESASNPLPQAPAASTAVIEAQAKAIEAGVDVSKLKDLLAIVADLEVRQAVMGRELEKTKTDLGTLQAENDRLKLQMQALGVAALSGDERSIQLRLLNAVSDFRVADGKRQLLREQLVQLCDAVTAWQNSSDVSTRRKLEEAVASSSGVLKDSAPAEEEQPTPVEQARVVTYKRELGLAVANCGKLSGLRMGMPLAFVRKDRTIAQGVIVDCRERLCGVLITTTPVGNQGVALGDAIRLETTENTTK